MSKKKTSANIPSIIITVAAVLLAAAAVIFVVITFSGRNSEPEEPPVTTPDDTYYPSQELVTEVETAAYELLPKNHSLYQYFTKGMSTKEEPYGNEPEDGFYTCVNEDYKTFEAFSAFIRETYTKETSEKLINDPFGYGPVYADDNGELGLSAKFKPKEDSGVSWEDTKFVCTLTSEIECSVTITLKDSSGKDVVKNAKMVKESGEWRLTEMIG